MSLALHAGCREVNLRPILQQINSLGGSVDPTEAREIRDRVATAERRLQSVANTLPETVDLSRVTRSERRRTLLETGTARPVSNHICKCKHRTESMKRKYWRITKCSLSSVRSLTRGAPWKRRGGAVDKRDDLFWVAIRGRTGPLHRKTFHLSRKYGPRITCL